MNESVKEIILENYSFYKRIITVTKNNTYQIYKNKNTKKHVFLYSNFFKIAINKQEYYKFLYKKKDYDVVSANFYFSNSRIEILSDIIDRYILNKKQIIFIISLIISNNLNLNLILNDNFNILTINEYNKNIYLHIPSFKMFDKLDKINYTKVSNRQNHSSKLKKFLNFKIIEKKSLEDGYGTKYYFKDLIEKDKYQYNYLKNGYFFLFNNYKILLKDKIYKFENEINIVYQELDKKSNIKKGINIVVSSQKNFFYIEGFFISDKDINFVDFGKKINCNIFLFKKSIGDETYNIICSNKIFILNDNKILNKKEKKIYKYFINNKEKIIKDDKINNLKIAL